jgi:5'-3' exonuclease
MISKLMKSLGADAPAVINRNNDANSYDNEGLLRHFILNSLRSYNQKFKDKYGELVIACDDKNYSRKEIYPYYKANRKKDRDASDLDWSSLFHSLNKIREEIKEHFGFRVIQVPHVEADDIIASLCDEYGNTHEKILIVSGDKDFRQLQSYMNVEQYDPTRKKFIQEKNPERYLKEHIMRGDPGDAIPSFLDPDDKYVNNVRAKQLRQTNIDKWLNQKPEVFCDDRMLRGYKRNEALVDLSLIPDKYKESILEEFHSQVDKKAKGLLTYFMEKDLKNLTDVISQFKVER